MKLTQFRKLIREEVRKVVKEVQTGKNTKLRPGAKGEDINMYPLTVVAGPFDSVNAVKAIIRSKYPKAMDVFQNTDLIDELNDTNASDVGGFYLVKGPDYDASGFTLVNGEDIVLD
jgi:hypothetical protein